MVKFQSGYRVARKRGKVRVLQNQDAISDEEVRGVVRQLKLPEFSRKELLIQALLHSSYARENQLNLPDNEKFETKGDLLLKRSFQLHFNSSLAEARRLEQFALSNVFIGEWARRMGILHCVIFGSRFKENLKADMKGDSARLVSADAFEALVYALYRDQGFQVAHEYLGQVMWPHAARITPETTQHLQGKRGAPIVSEDGQIRWIEPIGEHNKSLTRKGLPNSTVSVTVTVKLPDGSTIEGTGIHQRDATEDLHRHLRERLMGLYR